MEVQIVSEEKLNLEEVIHQTNNIKDLMSIETPDDHTEIKRLEKIVLLLIRKVNELEKRK